MKRTPIALLFTVLALTCRVDAQFGGTPGGSMRVGTGFDSVKVVAIADFARAVGDTLGADTTSGRVVSAQRIVGTAATVMPVFSNADSPSCVADSVGAKYFNTDQSKMRVCSGAGGWVNTGWTDNDGDGLVSTSDPQGIDDDDGTPFTAPTAVAADVLSGKTFRTGASLTPTTGTMFNRGTTNYTPSTSNQTVASGYHSGSGVVYSLGGNAPAAYVLSGYTFSSDAAGRAVSGSMTNRGAQTITPSTSNQTINAGYHNGSGYCAGDGDLTSANVCNSVTLFSASGSYGTCSYADCTTMTSQYACTGGLVLDDEGTSQGPFSCGAVMGKMRGFGYQAINCAWWEQTGQRCRGYTGSSYYTGASTHASANCP